MSAKRIRVKAPAKINYVLEILNRRADGYHNIQSIMQTVSLFDFLEFKISEGASGIILSGNSKEIPYNEKNLVYKAAVKFFEKTKINNAALSVQIEKHIPVSAGLAGGSADAAAALYALNKLFDEPLDGQRLDALCAELGSDLNFCLHGGCCMCTSRGEIIEPLPFIKQKVSVIKPKNLSISAKEAYLKFAALSGKTNPDNASKLKNLLKQEKFDGSLIYNSFEKALFPDYAELRAVKDKVKNSLMSGSGSAFFVLSDKIETELDESRYEIFENLETVPYGVIEI